MQQQSGEGAWRTAGQAGARHPDRLASPYPTCNCTTECRQMVPLVSQAFPLWFHYKEVATFVMPFARFHQVPSSEETRH